MRRVAAMLAVVLLLGCQERQIPVMGGPMLQGDSVAGIKLQHAEPPPPPEELPVPPRRKPSQVATAPDGEPETPDVVPDQLIGLDQTAAANLLGQPSLQNEKPPAKVWTYNSESCVLSLFFYADINTRVFRSLTYEIKSEDESDAGKQRCLAELVRPDET